MKRISGIAAAVAVVATLLAGAGALGASTATISCGMVVTSSIKAANDLTNCPGSGLLAGANGITIDLNGHTIDGTGAGDGEHQRSQKREGAEGDHPAVLQRGPRQRPAPRRSASAR